MRLQIGGADESTFRSAATAALEAFGAWQRHQGVAGEEAERVCAEVDLALDWKWSYADGDLGWWRSEHVGKFLLEWCPRKLSVFGDDAESIPSSLASFVASWPTPACWQRELAAWRAPAGRRRVGWAVQGGHGRPVAVRHGQVARGGRPGRRRRYLRRGPGRGVDGGLQRPSGGGAAPGHPRSCRGPFPTAARPGGASGRRGGGRVASGRPVLAMFAELAAFVGAGRRLTQKGNLSLADARVLVERLGTGDAFDERIGQRTILPPG